MSTRRQSIREKRKRQRITYRFLWGGLGLIALVAIGYVLWLALRPGAGQAVPVMSDSAHVEEGSDPGAYNSDPPTSGPHYANEMEAGFYDENALQGSAEYPEGYLVHNLEHGYVIFWYNCEWLAEPECTDLKTQIKAVMEAFDNRKLIAFPRTSLDVPLVMTSWGRMQRFEQFNPEQARFFITRNLNRAPEPNAP